MKSETLYIEFYIEGLYECYVSETYTFTYSSNGAGFHDPTTWDDEIYIPLILPNYYELQ